jgi:enamine deaminase RidA (YjgF/YER057c/UK114 family)
VKARAAGAAGAAALLALAACAPVMSGGGPGRAGFEPDGPPRYINPGTIPGLDGFTHAVKVGSTVYVSGEVALDSLGRLVGPGDLKAQAEQAFANLDLVLRIAGARPDDVVKLTVYVVNYSPRNFEVIRQAGAKFLPARNPPAGLVLGVQALPREGLLIAVDATAVIRAMFRPRHEEPLPPE